MLPKRLNQAPSKKKLIDNINIRNRLVETTQEVKTFNPIGYYSDKTDLREIHNFALKTLSEPNTPLIQLQTKLEEARHKLSSQTMIMIERKSLEKQIASLEKEIQDSNNQVQPKLEEFKSRIKDILSEWESKEEKGPLKLGMETPFDPEKLYLIRAYLQIASEFQIPLNMSASSEPHLKGICPTCRKPFVEDADQLICYTCLTFNDKVETTVSFSDIGRINNGNVNNYTEEETFHYAMLCFQGKQPWNIPPIVKEKIDLYCQEKRINKKVLRPVDIIAIFKEIGYPEYENANLFLSSYNGWTLPDISQYTEKLEQINRIFIQAYETIKVERGSAPNAFYRLLIYLRKEKVPVDISGLKIPYLRNTKIDLDFNARKAFDLLKWNFEDTT